MSETSNPMAAMFDVQRQYARQSQQFYEQGLEASLAATETVQRSLDATKNAQKKSAQVAESGAVATIDMMAASTPGGERAFSDLREAVEAAFEDLDEGHDEAWEAVEDAISEGLDVYEELSDAQRQMVADAVDAAIEANEEFEDEAERVAQSTGDEA